VQGDQKEINVDDILRCHTRSPEHLCIGDNVMSPPVYIKYLSLTPRVESNHQYVHVGNHARGSIFLHHRAGSGVDLS